MVAGFPQDLQGAPALRKGGLAGEPEHGRARRVNHAGQDDRATGWVAVVTQRGAGTEVDAF
jgi:hypothetical protein